MAKAIRDIWELAAHRVRKAATNCILASMPPATKASSVVVRFPNGVTQTFNNVNLNKRYLITYNGSNIAGSALTACESGKVANNKVLANDETLQVLPNPFNNYLSIKYANSSNIAKTAQVAIYDLSGKMVYTTNKILASNTDSFSLDLSSNNLASGMYILQVKDQEALYRTKDTEN